MKKVAVVILNWNGKELLEKFLPSVIQYTDLNIADIIVADNNSTDPSLEFLKSSYPQIDRIELPLNYGFAEGYNQALKQIDHEYYVLLNSDVEVTPNWLTPMLEYLEDHPNTAAIQPKILAYRNKSNFEYAGASGGFIDKLGYPFCRGRIFGEVETDKHQYDNPINIFWATGACMLIRSKNYWSAGALDASFFAHMEEIDLCWRLNARGHKLVCIPQSTVYHVGGATLNEESPRKTFLNFRNNLVMLYKNLPESEFQKIYQIRRALDYLAAIQMTISGKLANAKAIVKAHKEFKAIKNNYTEIRNSNLKEAVVSSIESIYPRSILKAFYIKGKKKFSNLDWM